MTEERNFTSSEQLLPNNSTLRDLTAYREKSDAWNETLNNWIFFLVCLSPSFVHHAAFSPTCQFRYQLGGEGGVINSILIR